MNNEIHVRSHVKRNEWKSSTTLFSSPQPVSRTTSQSGNVSKKMMAPGFLTRFRHKYLHFLLWGLALSLFSLFYITLPPTINSEPNCNCEDRKFIISTSNFKSPKIEEENALNRRNKHRLALLVPFKDRFEELMEFVPHINKFLKSQNVSHDIYVLNQVDNLRFNRASLLNVGFLESSANCDYVSLHDVDLLPMNPALDYKYPRLGPYHIAAPHLHPRYHYPTFIGGILLLTRDHYRIVDGLSNKYWGWGLEDDELYARFNQAKLSISRPGNLTTNSTNTFKHIHNRKIRKRDMVKCYNQQVITRRRDRETGLSTTEYQVHSRKEMMIDGAPVTVINIILECNHTITPWCDCTENIGNTKTANAQKSSVEVIVPIVDRKIHINLDG